MPLLYGIPNATELSSNLELLSSKNLTKIGNYANICVIYHKSKVFGLKKAKKWHNMLYNI